MRFDEDLQAEIDTPRVDALLAEVAEVCRRHGFSLHAVGDRLMVSAFDGEESLESLEEAFVGAGVETERL